MGGWRSWWGFSLDLLSGSQRLKHLSWTSLSVQLGGLWVPPGENHSASRPLPKAEGVLSCSSARVMDIPQRREEAKIGGWSRAQRDPQLSLTRLQAEVGSTWGGRLSILVHNWVLQLDNCFTSVGKLQPNRYESALLFLRGNYNFTTIKQS